MHSLHFTAETSPDGLVERDFAVGEVTGVLWSPASGADRAPPVLMGHGGGEHRKARAMAGRARRIVTNCGFNVVTIDAPRHGGRPRTAYDEQEIAVMQQAMTAGEPVGPIVVRYNAHLAERAVRIRPPMGRRAHRSPIRPRVVRRLRLEGKTLHANAGAHKELPRFEAGSAVRFFARHLGRERWAYPAAAVVR